MWDSCVIQETGPRLEELAFAQGLHGEQSQQTSETFLLRVSIKVGWDE